MTIASDAQTHTPASSRAALLRFVVADARSVLDGTMADVTQLVANHLGTETGEVAVLKGIQGARGYPF
jgi:hypothetical protein